MKTNILFNKQHILFLLTFAYVIFFSTEISAQKIFEGGIYGGVAFPKIRSDFNEYDRIVGGQGGFKTKIGCKWVQAEGSIEYSYQGAKYQQCINVGTMNNLSYNEKHTANIKYSGHHITIPLSLAVGYWNIYKRNYGKNIGLTVSGGGYVDFAVAGKINIDQTIAYMENGSIMNTESSKFSTKSYGDLPHQFKRFDAGWSVGTMFGLGKYFRMEAVYRRGIVNISNLNDYKLYNEGLFINLLLSFQL